MINPEPGGALYAQLAATLREQITAGTLRPGQVIPSERTLAQQYNVGRETVSRAVKSLRAEGLLEYRRGMGVFVREPTAFAPLTPLPGSTAVARMPTLAERGRLGLDDGVPVIEVIPQDGGRAEVYAADQWQLHWPT